MKQLCDRNRSLGNILTFSYHPLMLPALEVQNDFRKIKWPYSAHYNAWSFELTLRSLVPKR